MHRLDYDVNGCGNNELSPGNESANGRSDKHKTVGIDRQLEPDCIRARSWVNELRKVRPTPADDEHRQQPK